MKKQGIAHGAMLLAFAGIIVKIIGALFKIPLGAILGPEGMAIFSIAYNIYALLFVLSTAGIPVAMSKMIAEANAKKLYSDARNILRVALAVFAFVGAVASATLFFGASFFADIMGSIYAKGAIMAIAPAIFFVSIAAIFRGYYQGHHNMLPTAISEIIEALGKLLFGLAVAYYLSQMGAESHIVAAGAVLGVSIGAMVSAVFLLLKRRKCSQLEKTVYSRREILKNLLKTALPVTLGASIISLSNVIDSAVVMNLLQKIGYSINESMWLFGSYNYATTIFNLPSVVVTTLGISLIPALATAYTKKDIKNTSQTIESSLRISMIAALCAAFGLFALATPVIYLLYGSGVEQAAILLSGKMLSLLSLAIPALAFSSLSGAILQAIGDVKTPMYSMALGAMVKVVLNIVLVRIPKVNIYGACIATIACYLAIAFKNACALYLRKDVSVSYFNIFFKPTIIALLTGTAARIIMYMLTCVVSLKIAVVLSVLCGVLLCIMFIMLFSGLTKNDIKLLFGEKRITIFTKNH